MPTYPPGKKYPEYGETEMIDLSFSSEVAARSLRPTDPALRRKGCCPPFTCIVLDFIIASYVTLLVYVVMLCMLYGFCGVEVI